MSKTAPRILLLNQVSGPLFRELAEDLAANLGGGTLLTDMSMFPSGYRHSRLSVVSGPCYDRRTSWGRAVSWLLYFLRAAILVFAGDRENRLLIVSNPPFLAWAGWLAARLRGQRYAVLIYDVYPGLLENLGRLRRGGLVARLWRWSNRVTWSEADVVFTIGIHMATNVAAMLSEPAAARIRVISNWADGQTIRPRRREENWFAREHGISDQICVLYSGNLGVTHNLRSLLVAAERLVDDARFVFLIIGGGERWPAVRDQVAVRRLKNVRVLPWQAEEVLPYSLAAADVAVVTLEAGVEGYSVPSKTYYALAAGCALLVLAAGSGELSNLVNETGCGVVVHPDDAKGVITALRRFRDDSPYLAGCRARARAAQEQLFSRANTQQYVAAFLSTSSARSGDMRAPI